jgi:3-hydroxyisobutyrate dehydrogenase-like beta-hydroxyacid dehydrogenase
MPGHGGPVRSKILASHEDGFHVSAGCRALVTASLPARQGLEPKDFFMRLGFLGLGIMGTPMAGHLIRGGHEVTVWNRTAAACAPLVAQGARRGSSPAAVAAACDITFAMLADPAAALAVACGPDGVCEGIGQGRGYVDFSTVDPATSRHLAQAVQGRGGRFLEAPVSGSRAPAEQGTLVILAAGDEDLYRSAGPLLDLVGSKRFYLGPVGNGACLKLVVNMVMGGMMASFCEGLVLASRAGLEAEDLLSVLAAGAVANPMFNGKGPRMVAGEYEVAFPLKHMQKDLRLALGLAAELGTALPSAASAHAAFTQALIAGDGDLDFSALLRTVQA